LIWLILTIAARRALLLRLLVVVAAVKEIGKWIGAVNLWLGREKLHLSHRTAMWNETNERTILKLNHSLKIDSQLGEWGKIYIDVVQSNLSLS
jgi:hypothetical protein